MSSLLAQVSVSFATLTSLLILILYPLLLHRMRDSALRAVAFTCRKSHQVFQPALLENVTIGFRQILSFHSYLANSARSGEMIRSMTFKDTLNMSDEERAALIWKLATLSSRNPTQRNVATHAFAGLSELMASIFRGLVSLRTLVIEDIVFIPSSLKQLACFSTSLKKVHIAYSKPSASGPRPLNARNVAWLMTFSVIHEACLGFTLSSDDLKFLTEWHQTFSGLSKVKKLALAVEFVYRDSDQQTWWGLPKERNSNYLGGNEKTEAVGLILSSVNHLECLEICPLISGETNPGDTTLLGLRCLSRMYKSSSSLLHLRLPNFPITNSKDDQLSLPFRALRVFTLDRNLLYALINRNLTLPICLKKIVLPHYYVSDDPTLSLIEDGGIIQILRSQFLPHLEEIIIPSAAIGVSGKGLTLSETSKEVMKAWAKRRQELEKDPIFKDGKVKLTKFSPGEISE